MNDQVEHFDVLSIAMKIAVAVGIGMLIGLERNWSHKEAGIRTFSIVSLTGMLCMQIDTSLVVAGLAAVCLLIIISNLKSFLTDRSSEMTTSAALIACYILGVLIGKGHIFTPVAAAIVITMLLAWKSELRKFAGGLQPSEIRSAILLGLIGFVIYPLLPDRYIDRWEIVNLSDAWVSIIAIAGIGFLNYIFLKLFSSKGLYLGAVFGGLVNSTATIAEMTTRVEESGTPSRITILSSIINISMFTRNMILAAIFVPLSLTATLLPLLAMSCVAGFWIWRDLKQEAAYGEVEQELQLTSPISVKKILSFGLLFLIIQIGGTLLTRMLGEGGLLATGFLGGLVSSASTTAAAATMASHGQISPALAGSTAILSSMASALVDFPIVWKNIRDKRLVKAFSLKLTSVLVVGFAAVALDHIFRISEALINAIK
ncbi:Uncharacterized membrane protein, DUF4010 family [Chitinophaga sp. YR627]|uniref:MgtC/SapB family protein n=1 Tax=Chitinophaga sp. YR627 TaxID=1881041 RepID=UPI0008EF1108|nr:DUF4010 domain-containing protein [Chitinophaga sp. YR627]SFM69251.1 Uncharacterized membrane protein, DUF4010 family [Chitinophaga sp. YR627]